VFDHAAVIAMSSPSLLLLLILNRPRVLAAEVNETFYVFKHSICKLKNENLF